MLSDGPLDRNQRNYWCDCVRAYAILIVLVAHSFYVEPISAHLHFMTNYIKGDTGVYLFYVLSGFLVTKILSAELSERGSTNPAKSVRNFFARRIFRLQPSYLLFLIVYSLFPTQQGHLVWWQLLLPVSNWFTGPYVTWHLKTLHVEESYYAVVAPIAALAKLRLKTILAVIVCLAPTGRLILVVLARMGLEGAAWLNDRYFPFEPFALGGLTALHLTAICQSSWYVEFLARRRQLAFLVALFSLLAIGALRNVKPFSFVLLCSWPLLFSLASVAIILSGLDADQFRFAKPWMKSLGIASYSVYLFQQFVFGPWAETYQAAFSWPRWLLVVAASSMLVWVWSPVEQRLTQYGAAIFPRLRSRGGRSSPDEAVAPSSEKGAGVAALGVS